MKRKVSSKRPVDTDTGIKILYGTCIKDLDKQIDALTEKIINVTYYVSENYMAVVKFKK